MARTVASRRLFQIVLVLVLLGTGAVLAWWYWPPALPLPGSPRYEAYAEAFQVGTAALDVGVEDRAEPNLSRAIQLVPLEPAGWANRGLFYLRSNQLDLAAHDLAKAQQLAPGHPGIEVILGLLAKRKGLIPQAISHLRTALKSNPEDVATWYLLATLVEQEGGDAADAERQKVLEQILQIQPNNLLALLERLKTANRRQDATAYGDTYRRLEALSADWAPLTLELFQRLRPAANGAIPADILIPLTQFNNVSMPEWGFLRSRILTDPLESMAGTSLQQFLRLPPLHTLPAESDRALTYAPPAAPADQKPAGIRDTSWNQVLPVWLNSEASVALFAANAREVRRVDGPSAAWPFPSGPDAVPPSGDGVLALDWNNDYRTDLLFAGAGGLRFLEQQPDGSFKDVTAKTKLPAEVLQSDSYGAWAIDVEMDGDLDIILARRKGAPLLLRNNRDGTFLSKPLFPDVEGLRVLVWADLDNDGAPDAALLDAAGKLHVFMNERMGHLVRRQTPDLAGRAVGLTAGDVNDDGVFDLVLLLQNGELLRISDQDKGKGWDTSKLAQVDSPAAEAVPGSCRLFVGDLDNNGQLDLLVSSPGQNAFLLADAKGFQPLVLSVKEQVFGLADANGDGRLDLAAVGKEGPVWLLGNGSKDYHWQAIRPRADKGESKGNDRINSFGIGGEVEIRDGTLLVKQMITAPVVHFGLGKHKGADVLRLLWPNGVTQAEFDNSPNKIIMAVQRLKSSCPFLFTWDGEQMVFVTDFLWSTPLGMYINAQDKGGFLQTTDWVRIRGEQLQPRDGYLDVRVQANLWETHFLDHLGLLVVDHPPGTEVYVDERFFLTPTKPRVHLMEPAQPVARAWDHRGKDATDDIRAVDGKYLDRAGRGRFQGVTNDHWVEVDLGEETPRDGLVYLIAHGFVHPTDSSINLALEQGQHDRPRGLVLEVPDDKGGWKVGRDALGFPAGKNKTVVIRLDGIDGPGVSRRFRLRTNMEIYWDALLWARGLDASACKITPQQPAEAQLRFRGILEMTQASQSSPELPHYDRVIDRGQHWRDLIGFHTRFGDVRELLEKVDDRYVIMNAGDEIAFRFKALPAPAEGWRRDYVWVSDGWVKDGDLNTKFGKTVLPLPAHDMTSYDRPPGRLEDDPVYRRFPHDWETYHTRYITPAVYERRLRNFRPNGAVGRSKP